MSERFEALLLLCPLASSPLEVIALSQGGALAVSTQSRGFTHLPFRGCLLYSLPPGPTLRWKQLCRSVGGRPGSLPQPAGLQPAL